MLFWQRVQRLSNLLKSNNVAGTSTRLATAPRTSPDSLHTRNQGVCRSADRSEIDSALRMILGSDGRPADDNQVVDFLSYALHRGIDVNDIWVAECHGRIVWATLPVVSPGRTMLLLTPQTVNDASAAVAASELIEHVVESYRERGIQLAQVLLDPTAVEHINVFANAGFERLAELVYLHRNLGSGAVSKPPVMPSGFAWETYSVASHDRFAQTILQTYEGSSDCPALNGIRDIQDVLLGHKAAGDFDPAWWFLLTEASEPRGVLLLSRTRNTEAAELVYLGLIPAARGQGLAATILQQATSFASKAGCALLSLAVDTNNAPALKLYYRLGMQQVTSRVAMVRDLRLQSKIIDPKSKIDFEERPISFSTKYPHVR